MINFKEHIPLAPYSNFKIGGAARYFFEAHTESELAEAAVLASKIGAEIFVFGDGTNLLISDEGFPGLVIVPLFTTLTLHDNSITAGAGILMRDLLEFSASHGLAGLEWAGGLPGTVGGAIRGNAGCFGGETKDVIASVKSFDPTTMRSRVRTNSECEFGYRMSIWKYAVRGEIIMEATITLASGDHETIKKAIQEKIVYREARHPLEYPNIGSIFKNVPLTQIDADMTQISADTIRIHPRGNPQSSAITVPIKNDPFPVIPTAYLISQAGLKGLISGGAMVSTKHPNFIVNTGNARAKDVSDLIQKIKYVIYETYFIALEEEVERVGMNPVRSRDRG